MPTHQLVSDQIADPGVKLGRAFQVGEQEGEADDFQALIDCERVGAIKALETSDW
jgi:hypothetical protein